MNYWTTQLTSIVAKELDEIELDYVSNSVVCITVDDVRLWRGYPCYLSSLADSILAGRETLFDAQLFADATLRIFVDDEMIASVEVSRRDHLLNDPAHFGSIPMVRD